MEQKDKQDTREERNIYEEMRRHSCSVNDGYVTIQWEEGIVSIPIFAFQGMLQYMARNTSLSSILSQGKL